MPRKPWLHGTANGYNRHGCRCRTADGLFEAPQTMGCTEAWAEYRRPKVAAYRATHPDYLEREARKARERYAARKAGGSS